MTSALELTIRLHDGASPKLRLVKSDHNFSSIYACEISKFRSINSPKRTALLNPDEERCVFDLYQNALASAQKESDVHARKIASEIESFVTTLYHPCFIKIASSVAFRVNRKRLPSLDPADLVQEGALRFFNSTLKKFDPSLGSLEKYLQNWVRTAMWRSVGSKLGIFKIGPDMAADMIRVDRFCAEFNFKYSKDPTDQEIADGLGLEVKRVKSVFRAKSAQIASPILADGEELDRFDIISGNIGTPESIYSDLETALFKSKLLDDLLGTLDPQIRSLIERNLGFNDVDSVSVRSLGSELGVSHETVAKRIRTGMKKLEEEAKKYEGEIPF